MARVPYHHHLRAPLRHPGPRIPRVEARELRPVPHAVAVLAPAAGRRVGQLGYRRALRMPTRLPPRDCGADDEAVDPVRHRAGKAPVGPRKEAIEQAHSEGLVSRSVPRLGRSRPEIGGDDMGIGPGHPAPRGAQQHARAALCDGQREDGGGPGCHARHDAPVDAHGGAGHACDAAAVGGVLEQRACAVSPQGGEQRQAREAALVSGGVNPAGPQGRYEAGRALDLAGDRRRHHG